ncbi:MAG: hypothetical protein KDB06_08130 [Ilumatobacter sp.]|nr:hypothetical protein [Ilumatobacter sp.]MCB0984606.1 hypothetical protein [Ilumatobacter sp.]
MADTHDPTVPQPDPAAGAAEVPPPAFTPPPAMEPPAAEPLPTEPLVMAAAPMAEPPATEPSLTPTLQQPVVQPSFEPAPAITPTTPMTPQQAAPKPKGRALPWILAAVLGVAAIAFAVLWVGKSGDADDLTKERDTLTERLDSTASELDTTKDSLDTASADLADANAQIGDLTGQVGDLTSQVEDLQTQLDVVPDLTVEVELTDAQATQLGQSLGAKANPALTDTEAACFARTIFDELGLEAIVQLQFTAAPTAGQLFDLGRAIGRGLAQCNIEPSRLGFNL